MAIEQAPVEINLREPHKRGHDISALLWLCGWGVATAVALSALAITSQTKTATERLRSIFAINEPAAVAQMPPRVAHLESETRMLAEQVRALNTEREQLAGRIALLESSVDDITGTIKRQAAATAAALAARTPAPAPQPQPAAAPAVAAAPVAPDAKPVATVIVPGIKPDPVTTGSVPLPPVHASSAQASTVPRTPPESSNEFGLDLGGASTLDGVQQRWTTVKANFGPLLSGLHPLAAIERRQGKTSYRLVAGPLPNSPAATGLCAHFNAARTPCRAVKFEGEQIVQR